MSVAHQHPGDLVLALLGSTMPVSVTVLAHDSFVHANYRFVFNIIGETHLVSVEHDGTIIFQELLACMPLEPDVCRLYHPFHDLHPFNTQTNTYAVRVHFDMLPISADILTNYLRQQRNASLEVAFPPVYNCVPVTRIWWHKTEDSVYWRSLHVYPEADHITTVWSASSFFIDGHLQEQRQKEDTNVR